MPELNRKAVLIAVIIPDIARKEGGFPYAETFTPHENQFASATGVVL